MDQGTITMLDARAQYAALREPILAAVDRVLASGQWIGGPEIQALEGELARLAGTRHAIAVASGTDALLLSLKALGIGPGVDVVVPTYTFFATAGAVTNAGGRPVFADVEPDGLTLDPSSFERVLTDRTRVVIPVDLFGQCADYESIRTIARTRGVAVLEDAAQAIGASYHGRPAGSLGELAAFSFYPTKNLGACGDAGMVTTDNDVLAASVRTYAAHGSSGGYLHQVVGTNSRLDPVQAAILRVKLSRFDSWQASRARNAARYNERFTGHPALRPPRTLAANTHVYHQYVLRLLHGSRDDLQAHLREQGIASAVYYPMPLHLQECFADLGGRAGDHPVAETAARSTLALPVHPDLTEGDLDRVAAAVLGWADRQV